MSYQNLSTEDRIKHLRAYLKSISPDHELESSREMLESTSGSAAIDEGESLEVFAAPDRREDEALETLEVLVRDGDSAEVTAANLDSLEAIIHKKGRPAIDIINDSFSSPAGEWRPLGLGEARRRIERAIPSIGRIEIPNDLRGRPYAGTGFVVGKDLLMTNRHVARLFAQGWGQKNLVFDPGQTAAVDFKREIPRHGSADPVLLDVSRILMIHPYWDMALLEVRGLPNDHPALKLSIQAPEDMLGQTVAVIGYPARDDRNNIELQNEIFNHVYEVKRLLPGKLTGRRLYGRQNNQVNAATHDSSTLGGNSGSAVLNVDSGEIVALHFAGAYLDTNYAVPTFDLAGDSRVVDTGLNFTGAVTASDIYPPVWRLADAGESETGDTGSNLQTPVSTPPAPAPAPTPAPAPAPTVQITGNTTSTWTIPIHVSISVGTPEPVTTTQPVLPVVQAPPSEGLFSRSPSPSPINRDFMRRFSQSSLTDGVFSWEAALSAVLGSHVAYLSATGVRDISQNLWQFDTSHFIQVGNTECFVAASADLILVAFRGTEPSSLSDWLTDLNAFSTPRPYGDVHQGFLAAYQAVEPQLKAVLSGLPALPIILSGHSLGGALAAIAAAEWVNTFPVLSIYTFGQPATGKNGFRSFMQEHYADGFFRFVNDADIVTRVPPTYQHVGRLFHFNSSGDLRSANETLGMNVVTVDQKQPEILNETEFDRLRAQLLAERARRREEGVAPAEEGLFSFFSDHFLENYIMKVAAKADTES